ncbi:PREDICTED: integrin alpha-PS3-like isoform X2 [Vollenhovia emeryi]|uniref:integrin alpha-PS3-like isoform X2 n=1 Tax=Vollenhovia emeryi TaxID=411798 RepID=UPI0005F53D54|nr:PREDICTED: integrin alpha-PS3-like isoform X2 [Vollenhovia emeryi]
MTKFILFFNLVIVSAYNIDTDYPILYPNSATNADQYLYTKFERNYFGYTVLLHRDSGNASWLLIGAPRGNYTRSSRNTSDFKLLNEPGVVYQCFLPGPCVEIRPNIVENEKIYIHQINTAAYAKKEHSWFGGAMSIERKSDFLTVCAPRTIVNIAYRNQYIETLHGACFSGQMPLTSLNLEMSDITKFDFLKETWINPIHGFSVAFAPSQTSSGAISRIVGRPNDNVMGSVDVTQFSNKNYYASHFSRPPYREISRKTMVAPTHDSSSQFGYAVTSGEFIMRNQTLFACGDPAWNNVGQVLIMNLYGFFIPPVSSLSGSDIGEFFGASLASGHLNIDYLHDLVVGAPHWGNDNGRIHVYLGNPDGRLDAAVILEGAIEDAQFGYAVAIGDLDKDGYGDIIVGAPWEEAGAIYIYSVDFYNTRLKSKIRPTMSQRITMQPLRCNLLIKGTDIQTFGFSISEPIDIDNNGYVDIAVGAYKSGHVVVLRSKPVTRTFLTVHTVPSTLQININRFLITACVEYRRNNVENTHRYKISFTVDKKYKRTKETSLDVYSMNASTCVNATITLSDNIQNFIEPITIYASHDFVCNISSEFNKTCPVEHRNNSWRRAQALLPFDIGCGDDKVCNSNINATVKLWGVRENNTWVIGSNDITLETRLRNYAEPAYYTTIVFTLPKKVVLRSILPFCEEDMNAGILTVICNAGNPLGTDEQKVVKLDLDMRHLTDGSLTGQVLEFSTEIQTRSRNNGTHMITSPLTLQSEASLLLNGKALEKSYYLFNLNSARSNVIFQHVYQISKFGATPVEEAQLVVNLPTAVDSSDSLVLLYQPRIYISGRYYDCISNGVDLLDTQQDELPGEMSDAPDLYNLNYNNETMQNVIHNVHKRHVDVRVVVATLQTLYNMRLAITSEDSDVNLTVRERNIVYLNCSTYGVNCSTIYCDLSALRTQQNVGRLVMRLILNTTRFKDTFKLSKEMKVVKFSTDAHVRIVKPANRTFEMDVRHDVNVTTEFYSVGKTQNLQLWVVLVSVSLGLLVLCIVIIILNMVGFFKRTTKEEFFANKYDKVTENVEKRTSE